MADSEHVPPTHVDDGETDQEPSGAADVKSEDSGIPADAGNIDIESSLHKGNELHTAEEDNHDILEPNLDDKTPDLTHENEAESASTKDASGVSKEISEENGDAKPRTPAGDADKAVKKPSAVVKSSSVKTGRAGAPPLVKKVINANTVGAAKAAPPVVSKAASTSSATAKLAASATLKRATSAANAPASKLASSPTKAPAVKASTTTNRPTMSSRPGTSSSIASSTTTATRRPSLPPKPSLASSTSRRAPSPVPVPDATKTTTRTVVSPLGSGAGAANSKRPRASISDGLPPTRRTSMGPKPTPTPATKPVFPTRRTTGAGSISSLKDIKEDSTVLDHMQKKLQDAEASLKAQIEQTESLRIDLKMTRDQLEGVQAEARTKEAALEDLKRDKYDTEAQLSTQKAVIDGLRTEIDAINADLSEVRAKLSEAQAEAVSKADQVQALKERVKEITEESEGAKKVVESFKISSAEAVTASAAAAVEHEALLKAQADLEAIKVEIVALTSAHEAALKRADEKVHELESATARAEELAAQVASLKVEKEENASKLSELEVEILELREAAESAEDKESQALARIMSLEEQIATLTANTEQADIEAKKKDEEHGLTLEELNRQHEESLKVAAGEQEKLSTKLKGLDDELASATARHEQTIADAKVAEEAHDAVVKNLEKLHTVKAAELSNEIERLVNELAGQEAQYAAKVDAVKEEHSRLLQEAFEKAKTEAGEAHAHDLQTLRTQSEASIEQLNAAHKSIIDDLKAEHESALDAKVKSLDKMISNQSLELKATQDDLAKAKAATTASLQEIEALKKQLEEAEKDASTIATSSASEHAAEVLRLTRELSSAHDETTALKEVLGAQKDSISEMSNNHSKELEIAAKARAEEVTKLNTEHEAEVFSLLKDKSELASRVTDLEGELATLQATVAAQASAPAASKGNGVVPAGSAAVSKEDLQKLHEAHNLRLHDLEAQHERTVTTLRSDLGVTVSRTEELQNEVDRKSMEINYLESEAEEKDDTITRLKEDISHLSEELQKLKSGQIAA